MSLPKELAFKKILLVDDVASMRNMAKSLLWDAGLKSIQDTDNGSNALKYLKSHPVDLIICDWTMPEMSGLDLLKEVRQDDNLKSIPFLMLTASSDINYVKQAISEGVTDYITKPFQADAFCQKVIASIS